MNKKKFYASLFVIASIGAVVGFTSFDKTPQEDGALMENVEALSDGETDDCRFVNGFAVFTADSGSAYDCCGNWRHTAPDRSMRCR